MTGADNTQFGGLLGLREQFRAYYHPTDQELREAYATGTVALDTNVLLDLYRLSPAARASLLVVLGTVSPRLFVPYQVALEFHRNRARAVADRRGEFDSARAQLNEALNRAKGAVRQLATRAYGDIKRAKEAIGSLESAFGTAVAFVDSASVEYDLDEDRIVGRTDEILDSLAVILEGRVAPKPSEAELLADRAEALRRNQAKEPPGFRDNGKADNPEGDYLWWAETIRHARANPAPVVIVGNDVAKGDWTLTIRGIRIGLDPALVAEMSAVTGRAVYFRTTTQFLEDGGRVLDVAISEEALNEARALPQVGRPTQKVEFDDVSTITGVSIANLTAMQSKGWLPDDTDIWPWADVRRAAILDFASTRGLDEAELERISEFTRELRPQAHNVLVVAASDCTWLRSRDLDEYLLQLDDPPVLVIQTREFERKMRIIQASLDRAQIPEDGQN